MRPVTPLLLALILGGGTPVLADPPTTQPTTEPALREFTSAPYRLRFKCPLDWIVADRSQPGEAFSARTPANHDGLFGLVSLRIDRGAQGMSDEAMLVDVSDSLADYVFKNGGEHVRINPNNVGDLPGRRISFEKHNATQHVKAVYIVAIKGGVEYVFNFAAPPALFDSLQGPVNEMLKSFQVLD